MELDADICERARQSRDPRFDGRFFIAVLTTGIFCRPTCPVQPPLARNVRFYPSAAAALTAGFRPCLRCLPEMAPGNRRASTGPALVRHALKMIDDGFLDESTSSELAHALGVTQRHLARLFTDHVGASPHRVAHTRRLLFAKHLLDESELSVSEIAFAAGFGSLRRFNDAMKTTWQRSPRDLRRRQARPGDEAVLNLRLSYRPPLDWPRLLGFFTARSIAGVESVAGDTYSRSVVLDGRPGWLAVSPAGDGHALELQARLTDVRGLQELVMRVRRMFDLDADLMAVAPLLESDPLLAPVLQACPGIRIPGAWDPFEVAVRAVLGQQISVAAARTLATRIVETYGEPLPEAPATGPDRLFPAPARLADADLESLGVIGTRAHAIRCMARAVLAGELDFRAPDLVERLVSLPGIGDWTAQYVSMRSGHDPDAFPAADLGLLRGAEEAERMTPARLRRRAEAWRPWRAYAAICLWRRYATLTSGGN
jgi:AraC family transcriptional regulator, regulatory protein of adaptative response / DNA-3-methyladenine glycosylase II